MLTFFLRSPHEPLRGGFPPEKAQGGDCPLIRPVSALASQYTIWNLKWGKREPNHLEAGSEDEKRFNENLLLEIGIYKRKIICYFSEVFLFFVRARHVKKYCFFSKVIQ